MPSPRRLKVGDRGRFVAVVVVGALMAACGPKQENATLPAYPGLLLPVVDEVQPFHEKDAIEVTVSRKPETPQRTSDTRDVSADLEEWQIGLEDQTYLLPRESLRRLAEELGKLGKARLRSSDGWASGRALLLRADAEAPIEAIYKVLEVASIAKIPRIFCAVTAGPQGPTGVIACPLPEDVGGGSYLELRVELLWDSGASVLRRTVGPTKRDHGPDSGVIDTRLVVVPPGQRGDTELQDILRQRHGELEAIRVKENDTALDLTIAAGPRLQWQHVVRFIFLSRPTGTWRIWFAV